MDNNTITFHVLHARELSGYQLYVAVKNAIQSAAGSSFHNLAVITDYKRGNRNQWITKLTLKTNDPAVEKALAKLEMKEVK